MANILDKIIEDKKESLKLIKKTNSVDSLENTIKSLNNLLNFQDAISNNKGVSLITEIKKANSLDSIESTIKSLDNFLNFKDAFNKATKHLSSGEVFNHLTKLQSK